MTVYVPSQARHGARRSRRAARCSRPRARGSPSLPAPPRSRSPRGPRPSLPPLGRDRRSPSPGPPAGAGRTPTSRTGGRGLTAPSRVARGSSSSDDTLAGRPMEEPRRRLCQAAAPTAGTGLVRRSSAWADLPNGEGAGAASVPLEVLMPAHAEGSAWGVRNADWSCQATRAREISPWSPSAGPLASARAEGLPVLWGGLIRAPAWLEVGVHARCEAL